MMIWAYWWIKHTGCPFCISLRIFWANFHLRAPTFWSAPLRRKVRMAAVRKIFNVDCVLGELIIQPWKCVCIASMANFCISQMSSLSQYLFFLHIYFSKLKATESKMTLKSRLQWKIRHEEREAMKRWFSIFCIDPLFSGHPHLFLFLTYYRRQWRCWDDPFSCWFIFGLTWRRACHGVKNYFSQEIISPLLLLTLVLCTGELQSTGHTQAQIQRQIQIQRITSHKK